MYLRRLLTAVAVSVLTPISLCAQETPFFAGIDVSGGFADGSSDTVDGGYFGNGVVGNVEFGETIGVGGHFGYRFSPALSVSVAYQHIRGDVSWDARFPAAASRFEGTAISDVLLLRGSYDMPLSQATTVGISAGAGLSFNTLADVAETDIASGTFLADIEETTEISPAFEIAAGLRHEITPRVALSLDAAVAYTGDFQTGDTRRGNAGVTPIGAYAIDDVWRASLGASLRVGF